jgi:hypothetical protein
MMRKVMELKAGRGPEMTNNKQIFLENTGCAELSLLKRCWSDLEEEDFHKLMLMLQSFCLVFPLPLIFSRFMGSRTATGLFRWLAQSLHHVFSVPSSSTPPSSYVNLVHMDYTAEPNVPQLPEGVVSSQQAKGVLPDVTGKCK